MAAPSQHPESKSKHPGACRQRLVRGRLYRGYRLINHGYYPPDRCVWWEAENLQTGEADFRATTRRQLKEDIDSANGEVRHGGPDGSK